MEAKKFLCSIMAIEITVFLLAIYCQCGPT
uniref:Uncharacterized protein n=1 Tax=Rhizophora mucronata TaxID=61149 RepID=A0A2P2IZ67_RHIMU